MPTTRIKSCLAAASSASEVAPISLTTSRIAPHSMASPRAIAYRLFRSASLVFPTASAMLSGTDIAARRHWSASAEYPRGTSGIGRTPGDIGPAPPQLPIVYVHEHVARARARAESALTERHCA